MALQASALPREFFYSGSRIPDPDPKMDIEQVRDLLAPSYPEIATATMTGPHERQRLLREQGGDVRIRRLSAVSQGNKIESDNYGSEGASRRTQRTKGPRLRN
jgi:PRTRC genetic system protein C